MTATPPRRRFAILLAPAALLAAVALAPADEAVKDKKEAVKKASVPFEVLATKHILVKATINGQGPFRLIFDVGSPVTLLTGAAAEESKVIKGDAPRAFLFGARGEAEVDSLKVGDLEAKDVPVLVMDHPLLGALGKALGRRIDGLIGYTFFARYRTSIDYQAREMTFEPVPFKVRNLMQDLPERLAGPRVARRRVLAPGGLWGLAVGRPAGGVAAAGVPVLSVLPGSPAEAAGLKPGDLLTTLDGRWTASVADAYAAAAGVPPDRPAPVVVLRDGQELTLTVTPRDGI